MSSGKASVDFPKAPADAHPLTFPAHEEGGEAQVVNAEVHPALPGDLPLPVAARVVVDKFLFFGHPKQPVELHDGLLKLLGVVIFLHIVDSVIFRNDALVGDKAHGWNYGGCRRDGSRTRLKSDLF